MFPDEETSCLDFLQEEIDESETIRPRAMKKAQNCNPMSMMPAPQANDTTMVKKMTCIFSKKAAWDVKILATFAI